MIVLLPFVWNLAFNTLEELCLKTNQGANELIKTRLELFFFDDMIRMSRQRATISPGTGQKIQDK